MFVYLGNIVVFSTTFEEHFEQLQAVLQAIRTTSLPLKLEKCHFKYDQRKFLSHIVSSTGVRPDPEKATAVALFPMPKTKRDVHRFLGVCAYYHRMCQILLNSQNLYLQNPPILGHFDTEADTKMHTDASNLGLGAILVQFQGDVERVTVELRYNERFTIPQQQSIGVNA